MTVSSPSAITPVALVESATSTPSRSRACCTIPAASRSSRIRTPSAPSISVTSDPNLANDWAISTPIGPAPITARRRGISVSVKTVSLVRGFASRKPGIGGIAARVPVATHALEKSNSFSPTRIWRGPQNSACPRNTSTPKPFSRAAESWALIPARRRRIRSMAAEKSNSTSFGDSRIPNCPASRTLAAACAARISAFEGTHPEFRQSPPIKLRSTRATRAPSPAAPTAVTKPAVPPPITTMW